MGNHCCYRGGPFENELQSESPGGMLSKRNSEKKRRLEIHNDSTKNITSLSDLNIMLSEMGQCMQEYEKANGSILMDFQTNRFNSVIHTEDEFIKSKKQEPSLQLQKNHASLGEESSYHSE